MSLWDWISSIGDPEAQAAAQASTAMQPVVQDYLSHTFSQAGQAENLQRVFGPPPKEWDPSRPLAEQLPELREDSPALNIALGFSGGGLATKPSPFPRIARDDPAFGTAPYPGAKYPQYAEQYPAAGPPNMKVGERGNVYPEKQLTPEAIAFSKDRQKVMTDMNKYGYEPYFNPAERSYVDPSNYPPPNVDTSTLVPKKPDTVQKYQTAIGAPETMTALRGAYDTGLNLGDSQHWYAMRQLEQAYIDQLGPTAGRAAFHDEFATPMAATTSGNNPRANFMLAHYLERQRALGEPVPEGNQLPYPVGGRRVGVNLRDYENMRAGGGYAGLGANQPKMHNFDRSFLGDLSRPVMDEQMAGGMLVHAPGLADPARTTAYGLLEQPVHALAAEKGVLPGQVQDVAWAGFKNEQGKPMITEINDAIERTHRLTGMPRDEILSRGIIGKQIPIYGLLGGVGLGAADRYGDW